MNIRLVEPTIEWQTEIQAFLTEMQENKSAIAGMGSLETMPSVAHWLAKSERNKNPATVPSHLVRAIQYLYVDLETREIIGMIQLRCALNDYLKDFGGHIGYSIVPSKRRQGYGVQMLQACLIEAKKQGLTKVLLTCDPENTGSRKIIQANGGTYAEKVFHPEERRWYEKYWITIDV